LLPYTQEAVGKHKGSGEVANGERARKEEGKKMKERFRV
jgi:hypothetical protein